MRLRVATRSWLILAIGCWRPVRGLSGSACHEPWAPRREAITSSCYRNVLSAWTAPTCDRTWPAWILICTWTCCTPRPAATSGYVSCRTLTCVTRKGGVVILEIPPTSIFPLVLFAELVLSDSPGLEEENSSVSVLLQLLHIPIMWRIDK